ncbi:MAG: GNAT family N-acetyltransferase [Bacteroidota bacterium]
MHLTITQITPEHLAEYAAIPMLLTVTEILQPEEIDNGLGGILFKTVAVEPYVKDYAPHANPHEWTQQFDTRNWGYFIARDAGKPVGAMTLAFKTESVGMLDGREDLCVLWDIRVHPDHKQKGIGAELLKTAKLWAKERGCAQLKIETQNVNVPACNFYVKNGARLGAINKYAYGDDDIMLLWYIDL